MKFGEDSIFSVELKVKSVQLIVIARAHGHGNPFFAIATDAKNRWIASRPSRSRGTVAIMNAPIRLERLNPRPKCCAHAYFSFTVVTGKCPPFAGVVGMMQVGNQEVIAYAVFRIAVQSQTKCKKAPNHGAFNGNSDYFVRFSMYRFASEKTSSIVLLPNPVRAIC